MYTDVGGEDCVTKCAMTVLSQKQIKIICGNEKDRKISLPQKVIQITKRVRKIQQATFN